MKHIRLKKRKKIFTEEDFNTTLELAFVDGSWHRFPRVYLRFLTIQEAMLLSFLQNHSVKCKKATRWFYCKMEKIETELQINRRTQSDLIRRLKHHDLIETKIEKHMPPRRMIRIKYDVLLQRLKETKEEMYREYMIFLNE